MTEHRSQFGCDDILPPAFIVVATVAIFDVDLWFPLDGRIIALAIFGSALTLLGFWISPPVNSDHARSRRSGMRGAAFYRRSILLISVNDVLKQVKIPCHQLATVGFRSGVMRVLLIEDDCLVAETVQDMLAAENYVCNWTESGEDGLDIAKLYDYDIIILDLTLPDIDGVQVLRRLREATIQTPVLILSGRGALEDKVEGLKCGADDYLTKPFHKGELIARVQSLVRRSKGHSDLTIRIGRLAIDIDAKSMAIDGKEVRLTGTEYRIMELLALGKGRTLSKEMFLSNLYDGCDEPDPKIIDVYMCKLRQKLAQASGGDQFIETVWGRGHVLCHPSDREAGQGQNASVA